MALTVPRSAFSFSFPAVLVLLFSASVSGQTLVVVPFDNRTGDADLDWVGEAFAEGLTERLAGLELELVSREERVEALERLGLSAGPVAVRGVLPLTRASLLRLGEELEADWVALGSFAVEGDRLRARVRLLDLRRFSLSASIEQEGRFAELREVEAALAWKLSRQLVPSFSQSFETFRHRFTPVPVSAFESYLRGLLAASRARQTHYWLQAVRLSPAFSAPAYQLGRYYFEEEDYAAAVQWLEKVPLEDPYGFDARFYLALARFHGGNPGGAADVLRPLAERLPVTVVWNNLAVFVSRAGGENAGELFERALAEDSVNFSLPFNLGLHYMRRQQWQEAAGALNQCLDLNPADTEARFLLSRALDKLGQTEEAGLVREQAVGDNPALALSLESRQLDFDRLVTTFSSALARRALRVREESSEPTSRAQHLAVHLDRGEELLAQSQLELARQEFVQAILLAPDSYRGHLRLAEVYRRQGRVPEAMSELRAAVWSRDTVEARLRLAELYLSQERPHDARIQVQAALALEPENREATALAERIEIEVQW